MEVYKIRHIPSGLFIQPSKASNMWSTLGKKGKIYEDNGNIWTRVKNRNEYISVCVHKGYTPYKELAEKFPELVEKSVCHYGILRVNFHTKPEDFEKVVIYKD